ncbi:hypothetical protein QR680_004737 [Steinernema hermaphroditum]|uniref:Uncharacterized protein n=1 Tax=Steinernema hermaphroditum TaxID=289476 RepID=A0AA39LU60_9BILA|nr:hypothetical protein QR680_004737 [Steinernema hermaphroditum]
MDSVPYCFCFEVLRNLFIDDVDYIESYFGGIWKAAAKNIQRGAIKLYILSTETSLQYYFTLSSNCPQLDQKNNYSIDQLETLRVTNIRIADVTIGNNGNVKHFAEDGSWEADFGKGSRLVKFILRNLQRKNAWIHLCHAGETQEVHRQVLEFFSRIFFDRISIIYNSEVTDRFLRAQLNNHNIRNLLLTGKWKSTVKEDLENYILNNDLQSFSLTRVADFGLDVAAIRRFAQNKKYKKYSIRAPFRISEEDVDKDHFADCFHMNKYPLSANVTEVDASFDRELQRE